MRRIESWLVKCLVLGFVVSLSSSIAFAASKCPQYKTLDECLAKCSAGKDACAAYLGMECGSYCKQALPEQKGSIYVSVRNTQTGGTDLMVPIVIKGSNGYWNKLSTRGSFVDLAPGEYTVYVDSSLFSSTESKVKVDPAKRSKYEVEILLTPKESAFSGTAPVDHSQKQKECKKKTFCKDKTLYEGVYDPVADECKFAVNDCRIACNPVEKKCVETRLKLTGVEFFTPEKPLVLNGRSTIIAKGQAHFDNPYNESVNGQHIGVAGHVAGAKLSRYGMNIYGGTTQADGSFSVTLASEQKVDASLDLREARATFWPKEFPDTTEEALLQSPAPVIWSVRPAGKQAAWQDAYKVFDVTAQDPDNNIDYYTVMPEAGTIRHGNVDWDGYQSKKIYTYGFENPGRMTFGWLAPKTTEMMELQLARELAKEWLVRGRGVLVQAVDAYVKDGATALRGEEFANAVPGPAYLDKLIQAQKEDDVLAGAWETVQYAADSSKALSPAVKVVATVTDGVQEFRVISGHAAAQARKMGESLESNEEFGIYERAFRTGSILLDGAKYIDGAVTVVLNFSDALGVGEGLPLGPKLALIAKRALVKGLINTLQKGTEHIADVFKAGGAQIKSNYIRIFVSVSDKDGYQDIGGIQVEVQGYETLLKSALELLEPASAYAAGGPRETVERYYLLAQAEDLEAYYALFDTEINPEPELRQRRETTQVAWQLFDTLEYTLSEVKVAEETDSALVTYRLKSKVAGPDESGETKTVSGDNRFAALLFRRNGMWKVGAVSDLATFRQNIRLVSLQRFMRNLPVPPESLLVAEGNQEPQEGEATVGKITPDTGQAVGTESPVEAAVRPDRAAPSISSGSVIAQPTTSVASKRDQEIRRPSVTDYRITETWNGKEKGYAQNAKPITLALDREENLFVTDFGDRIQKFSAEGNLLAGFKAKSKQPGYFNRPFGVAVDSRGNVFVCDYSYNKIHKFDVSLNYLKSWDAASPWGIAIDSKDRVYVAHYRKNQVSVFSTEGGQLGSWGREGSGSGQFRQPTAIAADGEDNVIVLDSRNYRIQKFDHKGNFLTAFGKRGTKEGEISDPRSLTADAAGNVYVATASPARILQFDRDGNFIAELKIGDEIFGRLTQPSGIAADRHGNLYLIEAEKKVICKLAPDR